MRSARVLTSFKRTKELAVEFCERCSKVCDSGCRRAALQDSALLQAWSYGAGV